MAKGVNGTIDPLNFDQLINQRAVISNRNTMNNIEKPLGVASNRMEELFPKSPLLVANRSSGVDSSRDPDGIQVDDGDVYKMYANVIDPDVDASVLGFGFEGFPHPDDELSNVAYLNYRHPNNPFLDGEEIDNNKLTSGKKSDVVKSYQGFPDLDVSGVDLSRPAVSQDSADIQSNIEIENKSESNFGHLSHEFRAQQNQLNPDNLLGRHTVSETASFQNGDEDYLGMYFKRNIAESE